MKINKYMKSGALAAAALALVCSGQRALAQIGQPGTTQKYTDLKFTFPTTGPTETAFTDPTWIYWYNYPGGNTPVTTDPTTDKSNNTPGNNTSDSGSLKIVTPFPLSGDSQNLFFGCFADNGSYSFSEVADLTTYQSVDFDILVQAGQTLSSGGTYGGIGAGFCSTGYSYQQAGSATIPSTAAAGWVHISVPIVQSAIGSSLNQLEPSIALDYNNYGGFPAKGVTFTFWVDNVELVPSTAPPAPPPSMTGPVAAVAGLNTIWTIPGANGQYNRYHIIDTNDFEDGNDSFSGQASVTYSFTIAQFPVADTAAQAHFFIVNGPDSQSGTSGVIPNQYDTAADYNMANCIFSTVQSDGAGNGIFTLHWKVNDAQANDQIFGANANPAFAITNGPLLGTWSLTIAGNNYTLTGPGGSGSTTLPSSVATAFAEGNGPSSFLLGSQPNATTYAGGDVIYSSFSRTGNHAFTDHFATDSALNTADWEYYGSAAGEVIVPPSASFWIDWTLPALNYAPVVTASLNPKSFSAVNPIAQFPNNGEEWALLPGGLPAGKGFFQVVQRKFSQLVVVLPGQTFTPGVSPGYSGTPTPVTGATTLSGDEGQENVTIYAVDADYYPVPGIIDTVAIVGGANSDSSEVLPSTGLGLAPDPNNANESDVTFNTSSSSGAFYFGNDGTFQIYVQDTTTATIPIAASAPVVSSN